MPTFLNDLRHGARGLARSPGVWLLAVLTLGLGVAANSAIFSVCDAVFRRPLAQLDPARHVSLTPANDAQARFRAENTIDDYLAWRSSGMFDRIFASRYVNRVIAGAGEPERVQGTAVTPDFFEMFNARPVVGRFPAEAEHREGSNRVLVLSHGFWTRRFNARPDIAGQTVKLDDAVYTIVGVAPPELWFPEVFSQFWTPMTVDPTATSHADRGRDIIARLKPGVTPKQARQALIPIARDLEKRFPDSHAGWSVRVQTLFEGFYGPNDRGAMILLYLVSGGVLLIACANVANLLLARGLARRREMSIRVALGASRSRLIAQTFAESMLLAAPAGLIAMAAGAWASEYLLSLFRLPFPVPADVMDLRFTLVNALAALASILVFGLSPALMAARTQVAAGVHEGGPRATMSRATSRFSRGLVVVQVGLALSMVMTAVLGVRGMRILLDLDPGFDRSRLVRAEVSPSPRRYAAEADYQRFYRDLLARAASSPGVESAALISTVPAILGNGSRTTVTPSAQPAPERERPSGFYIVASPGAMETLGIPLRRGRTIQPGDSAGSLRVAVVNEKVCETLFPGRDPIGLSVQVDALTRQSFQIVGVYANLRPGDPKRPVAPQLFVAQEQAPRRSMQIVARANSETAARDSLRAAVRALDAEEPVTVRSLAADVEEDIGNGVVFSRLLAVLAGAALFLGGGGLFALVSQTVTRQLPEIGLRLALGATEASVRRLVFGAGLRLVLAGVALGIACGLGLGRLLAGLLVDASASDWQVLVPSCLLLAGVAMAACFGPARRAMRTDPVTVLRQE